MAVQTLSSYPTVELKEAVVFPYVTMPIVLEGREMIETLNNAISGNHVLVLSFSRRGKGSGVGVACRVLQSWYVAENVAGATIEGLRRVKIIRQYQEGLIQRAEVVDLQGEVSENEVSLEALARGVLDEFEELIKLSGLALDGIVNQIRNEYLSPEKISDLVSFGLRVDFKEKIELLETLDVGKRLRILREKIIKELNISKAEQKIQKDVQKEVNKTQREYILRERLRAIEKELGITEESEQFEDLENKIKISGMPKETELKALKELSRLRRMQGNSAEAPYIWTYLETLADLPFNKKTKDEINLNRARIILNRDHYGLGQVKNRILEHLAVQKLVQDRTRGGILCFIGPPGVGKTSVGESIARALGRKFIRISLGGVRDESEIRGHRRTYVGALPGRIIQGIRSAKVKNPVFMIDEIDKIGADYRGDPAAALLEVLDPAQNNSFTDHYLETPFDLSEVFFITTANVLDMIPFALRDRMETIEFTGYIQEEKLQIAKKHLLPKVLKDHGLNSHQIQISDSALKKIISLYTREAGVRELERKIAHLARAGATKIVTKKVAKIEISENDLEKYLGPASFTETVGEANDEIGVATGLAWTPVGGEIISIEASALPGPKSLTLTGQLGEVMQESARAALTFVRSRAKGLKIDPKISNESDIHIHVPSGGVPKDGPSAGVAMALALASALSHRKVKKDVALTGEITLRGKVMEVGGIKEKVLAAYRSGLKTVLLPQGNKKDLAEVGQEVKKKIKFHFISSADEALKIALEK